MSPRRLYEPFARKLEKTVWLLKREGKDERSIPSSLSLPGRKLLNVDLAGTKAAQDGG